MRTTGSSGRTFLPLLTLSVCLLTVATLSGCGSPSTQPAPGGDTAADAGQPQADQALAEREAAVQQREADQALAEREAAVQQRETDLAARDRAATQHSAPRTAPRSTTVEHGHSATPTNVASHPLAGDGPTPAAEPRMIEIPAGTQLQVELLEGLSSGTSIAGQQFGARLSADVVVNGTTVFPAGSSVSGTVTETVARKKIGGKAQISMNFDHVTLPSGRTVAISAPFTEVGKSETGKDAATIGGAAVAGAILGHQIDDKHGKLLGAVLGGAAGTAVASKTGHEVELPTGTVIAVPLDLSAHVNLSR